MVDELAVQCGEPATWEYGDPYEPTACCDTHKAEHAHPAGWSAELEYAAPLRELTQALGAARR